MRFLKNPSLLLLVISVGGCVCIGWIKIKLTIIITKILIEQAVFCHAGDINNDVNNFRCCSILYLDRILVMDNDLCIILAMLVWLLLFIYVWNIFFFKKYFNLTFFFFGKMQTENSGFESKNQFQSSENRKKNIWI